MKSFRKGAKGKKKCRKNFFSTKTFQHNITGVILLGVISFPKRKFLYLDGIRLS